MGQLPAKSATRNRNNTKLAIAALFHYSVWNWAKNMKLQPFGLLHKSFHLFLSLFSLLLQLEVDWAFTLAGPSATNAARLAVGSWVGNAMEGWGYIF